MLGDLDTVQVERLLKAQTVGRLVLTEGPRTYVLPVQYYAYELPDVYISPPSEPCVRMMQADGRVGFEVDDVEGPREWKTLVAWGRFQEQASAPDGGGHRVCRIRLDDVRGFWRSPKPQAATSA